MHAHSSCRLGRGSPRSRLLALSAAALLGVSLLSVAPSPARPSQAPVGSAQPSSVGADPAGWDGPAGSVTLITGDTVSVDGEGRVSVEPGPGREDVDFRQHRGQDRLRVVPADAARLVAADRLDAQLFDISYLLSEGYGDGRRGSLPLLVDGGVAPVREVVSGPGARITDRLPLTGFSVVSQGRGSAAGALWRRVTDTADGGHLVLESGIQKVWLNGKVHATLEDSVPQIGAPEVWASGHTGAGVKVAVLDTGVDGSHPDLAGQVVANQVFSESPGSGLFTVEQLDDAIPYLRVQAALAAPKQGSSALVDVGRACVETGGDQLTGDPAGKTALVVRGLCPFAEKYDATVEAGATGVVFYNDVPGLVNATIAGAEHAGQVWAAGTTDADGAALADLLESGETVNLGFTDRQNPGDLFGHGTHVASTIAGTGAGSDGLRKGVAPDATVMNGKVLSDTGSGDFAWVIAGMEWAAANGADVINMSLGGGPTDGTDPVSQAVNTLTAEHDVLFVISAGNLGAFGPGTVGTPGAADAALTVGAVDKQDVMAYFSSRGPRLGDFAVKPNITAPGVDIVAARATGTSMGGPVDDLYTTASGTSMAAPHVAGTAALLAQARPELGALALKDALASTSVDGAGLWFDEGTGRVDVARAVTQGVYADASVNFGRLTGEESPVDRQVTYTNHTDERITLQLQASLTDVTGGPVDGLSLSARKLAIRPHRTATVAATLDPQAVESTARYFGGVITATATDVTLRTAVGAGVDRITAPLGDDWNEDWTNTYAYSEGDPENVFSGIRFNGSTMSSDGTQIFIYGVQQGSSQRDIPAKITVAAIDAASGEPIWVANEPVPITDWTGPEINDAGIAVSPDGSKLFVSSDIRPSMTGGFETWTLAYNNVPPQQSGDPELGEQLWKATTGQLPYVYGHGTAVTPDGETVLIVRSQGERLSHSKMSTTAYDASTGEERWTSLYSRPDAGPDFLSRAWDVAIDPAGDLAYVTGWENPNGIDGLHDTSVTVAYELRGESQGEQRWVARQDLTGEFSRAYNASMSADGERLFVGGAVYEGAGATDGRIELIAYDPSTGELLWASRFGAVEFGYAPGHTRPGLMREGSIAVSPDNDRVFITGTHCEGVRCNGTKALVTVAFDQQTGDRLWSKIHETRGGGPNESEEYGTSAIVSPDGTKVYVSGHWGPYNRDTQLTLAYDAATGEHLATASHRFVEDGHNIGWRAFTSPDGSHIYTVGAVYPDTDHTYWALSAYSPPIPLEAAARQTQGEWFVDLIWSGSVSDEVDVYRDGQLVATVDNTGSHTDTVGRPQRGTTFLYQVCQAGTDTCSKEVPVTIGDRSRSGAASVAPPPATQYQVK